MRGISRIAAAGIATASLTAPAVSGAFSAVAQTNAESRTVTATKNDNGSVTFDLSEISTVLTSHDPKDGKVEWNVGGVPQEWTIDTKNHTVTTNGNKFNSTIEYFVSANTASGKNSETVLVRLSSDKFDKATATKAGDSDVYYLTSVKSSTVPVDKSTTTTANPSAERSTTSAKAPATTSANTAKNTTAKSSPVPTTAKPSTSQKSTTSAKAPATTPANTDKETGSVVIKGDAEGVKAVRNGDGTTTFNFTDWANAARNTKDGEKTSWNFSSVPETWKLDAKNFSVTAPAGKFDTVIKYSTSTTRPDGGFSGNYSVRLASEPFDKAFAVKTEKGDVYYAIIHQEVASSTNDQGNLVRREKTVEAAPPENKTTAAPSTGDKNSSAPSATGGNASTPPAEPGQKEETTVKTNGDGTATVTRTVSETDTETGETKVVEVTEEVIEDSGDAPIVDVLSQSSDSQGQPGQKESSENGSSAQSGEGADGSTASEGRSQLATTGAPAGTILMAAMSLVGIAGGANAMRRGRKQG